MELQWIKIWNWGVISYKQPCTLITFWLFMKENLNEESFISTKWCSLLTAHKLDAPNVYKETKMFFSTQFPKFHKSVDYHFAGMFSQSVAHVEHSFSYSISSGLAAKKAKGSNILSHGI